VKFANRADNRAKRAILASSSDRPWGLMEQGDAQFRDALF
jgi:hypothetical protein